MIFLPNCTTEVLGETQKLRNKNEVRSIRNKQTRIGITFSM